MRSNGRITIRAWISILLIGIIPLGAEWGPTARAGEIKVGNSSALTGHASALGIGMRQGIEARFQEVNEAGGIHGHTLRLIALDDGYEPRRTAPNVRRLITQEQVIALIGNTGTPTAVVTVPIVQKQSTPLFGAYSGAALLRRQPPDRFVVNFRASYREETAAMVRGLLEQGIPPERIAFFTQNDSFGDDGHHGAVETLRAFGYAEADALPHGRYTRNTLNVEEGLSVILAARTPPRAIILVGSHKPCAAFIRLASKELPETLFLAVSFVGGESLTRELGEDAEGVIVSQVVPSPEDDAPALRDYRSLMHAAGLQPGYLSLEGYLAARLFTTGLEKAGPSPTRLELLEALEGLGDVDIGMGSPLHLGHEAHQASHRVWLTVIRAGRFVPLDWKER
ncbi:MAG: ABC transporter substrate-binding protein [Magnetococcales bacterium]|nr:ABC transporter substrate-binding protein [Magnetococcales bacterium]